MSDLQRQLKSLKSMEGTPEILLTSSLNVFSELVNSLDHTMEDDEKTNIRKYYQFLVECYKLIDKAILNPEFLQSLAEASREGAAILLVKQFIIVWTSFVHGHDDLLTLKLWMNLITKLNALKNTSEFLCLSKVFLETFYPQTLCQDQTVRFDLRMIKRNLQLDAEKQDIKLSQEFLSKFTQGMNMVLSSPGNIGMDSLRVLLGCVMMRMSNLTLSEKTFSFANKAEWELLLSCYQLLLKLYRDDGKRVAELFKVFFKDYFKLIYRFSGLALDKGLLDSQVIWRLRTESFLNVIELQVFDLNDLGNYLIDSLRKMPSNLIMSFKNSIIRALMVWKKSLQSKTMLMFFSKLLTHFEESCDAKEFFKMISLLISQDETAHSGQALCSVEFWTQNLNKSQYLPSVISFVLGKLLKQCSDDKFRLINILFTQEMAFCMKGLQMLSRFKILQEPQKEQDSQIDYMISRLTAIYNNLEKIKMAILTEFLNKKSILAILEGQVIPDDSIIPGVINRIQETSGLAAISELFEVQPRIFKILAARENTKNPNRFISVSINNKFYNLLYMVLTRKFVPALVSFPNLKKALQEYLGTLFQNKESLASDSNLLKDIQSSIHYLGKVLETLSSGAQENISLVEDVILTIHDLSLFETFDPRLVGGIANSLCKTLKNSGSSSIQCLFKLYKSLFNALQNMMGSPQSTVEQKDNMHKIFEVLTFTEVAIIRVGLSIPELAPAEMEVEGAQVSQNPILKQFVSFEWNKTCKKFLLKARIRVLVSLFADESCSGQEICSLFYLIEHELQETIKNSENLKVIKCQILWLEVLYILTSKKSEAQLELKSLDHALDQAFWRFAKQFKLPRTQTPLKQEEILLKVLKEGIMKKLEGITPTKQFRYHLIHADLSRKMVYLQIYSGLQETEENLKIENVAKRTSQILHEFRNSLGAFYSVLNLEASPSKNFKDYMTTWLGKRSEPRSAITKILSEMKVSDALKIQKFLSSFIEIADYLCLSDETEKLLKIAIVYWICLGNQFSKGFDKKTRAVFNTRIQLLFAIMQIKLAIVYQKKSSFEDSENCFKNFTNSYQKDAVDKALQFIDQDVEYQSFFIELRGLKLHLDSLVYEYQIRTNQLGAFENFKQFLQKLDKDPKIEKLKSSALMILKVNLLLYSGQLLYSSGHPAYSIQEVRKCLDHLINYGFNYVQTQGIDQILSKQMDTKPDRFDRLCLLDLKYLNEAAQFTKDLSSESGNLNTVGNILNMLFPKNFALNFSKLSVLSMMARTMKKLSKISYNIGLLCYSEYYCGIMKNYTLKTTQALKYIKMMTRENIKKQENDAPSSLKKEERIDEINKVIDNLNVLACPIGYNLKVLPNQKKIFSWNQKLFDSMRNDLSKATWVDSTWVDVLTQFLKSTIMANSSHNQNDENKQPEKISQEKKLRNNDFASSNNVCEIFQEFAKSSKFSERRMLPKDWFKTNHVQYKAKPFEFWSNLMKLIDDHVRILRAADEKYTFEGFIWLFNCTQIVRHIIYKTSLLHAPLTKQALILKQTLCALMKKYLGAIFKSKDLNFLKELAKVSQLQCGCGKETCDIISEQNVQNFGDSFNQEIDFWLTCSDVVFTYKHQIKNIRKVLKSNKGGDKKTERDDLRYIRKSLKTLKINPEQTDSSEIKFLSNLKDVVERDFEEYSVKSTSLTQKMSKYLGDSPILIVKFIKKKKQKMLFIAKVYKDPKKNVCFIMNDSYNTNYLNDVLLDFSKIISTIEKDLGETSKAQKSEKEKADLNVSKWFNERYALDKRMETSLKSLEATFGYYKGVMLGDFVDKNLNHWIEEKYKNLQEILLKEIENSLETGLYSVLIKELKRDVSSYIHILKGLSILSVLEKHTERQFKADLDEMNENLCFKILSEAQQAEFKANVMEIRKNLIKNFEGKSLKRNPVVLLLDEHFQFLPFECMPLFLAQNQSFLRIPSLEYIRSLQHDQNYVNLKDTSYVLNAGKDLEATQERFQDFLQRQETWKGIIGEEPKKEFLKQALTQNECYLYIGHGAGEKYFNENELKEIMKVKSAVLLIGCSSAKQVKIESYISKGEAELGGISIEYLLSNCPFLAGNLWDVTDRDMDTMTQFILEAMTTPNSVSDFLEVLQQARNQSKMKMKYLNGSALVCYGVPLGFVYN